jgi:Arc/MetJ-type ribon-helix-helix transcriptional regulator
MKTISVELPDRAAEEIDALVRAGWFASQSEVIRAAVLDFLRRNRIELLERFHREDIAWALASKAPEA